MNPPGPRPGTPSARTSLQARLLTRLVALLGCVWLLAAGITLWDARHEVDELLDSHLAQAAALLVVQQTGSEEPREDGVADAPMLHRYASGVAFQVFHEGRLTLRSANAGTRPMSAVTRGFSRVDDPDSGAWRVFAAQGAERDVLVFVAERSRSRNEILLAVLRGMLGPLLFALPLLGVVIWWTVRRELQPLQRLRLQLTRREPTALQALPLERLPSELQPVVQALNSLFERIARMVETERRFTADAAHELRTPIAAIRAQAQVARAAVGDPDAQTHALRSVLAGCDRAARLVDQLLQLARLEADPGPTASDPSQPAAVRTDLAALAQRVAAELAPVAIEREQDLSLEAGAPCPVGVAEPLLAMLLRNLLDNALRYSPAGARIAMRVHATQGGVRLQIEDSGPGLAPEQARRLGERFFRAAPAGEPGSGLGWSIVRRIAQASGGRIEVGRSPAFGGLS
ncbi:MAG: HAMP domain-containing protein, partial [Rhodoferax sp.]|nr:HAMP domain-containing protein [Rhodoferax sp.]